MLSRRGRRHRRWGDGAEAKGRRKGVGAEGQRGIRRIACYAPCAAAQGVAVPPHLQPVGARQGPPRTPPPPRFLQAPHHHSQTRCTKEVPLMTRSEQAGMSSSQDHGPYT